MEEKMKSPKLQKLLEALEDLFPSNKIEVQDIGEDDELILFNIDLIDNFGDETKVELGLWINENKAVVYAEHLVDMDDEDFTVFAFEK